MRRLDPYAALGLASNPFVAEERPGVPDGLWVERGSPPVPRPGARRLVQVIGEKGAGKTSLLLRWRGRTAGPYLHFPPGAGRWRWPPLDRIAFWDEADRIPAVLLWLALRRAARRGATVVAGTHRDLWAAAARARLAVETVALPPLDAPTLRAWAGLRIAAARRTGATEVPFSLDPQTAAEIAAAACGSWRVAGDRLHAWAAGAVESASK